MGFLRTYRGKIILIAFIGIQIPLLTLIYYFWLSVLFPIKAMSTASLAIAPTLPVIVLADILGTSITLSVLYYLLIPIALTSKTLGHYLQNHQLKHFPLKFQDDANTLIADTDATLEKLERIIQHLIHYDTLTGLPNRELFQTYVQQAISENQDHQQFALIILDLNSLKNINSTLGRQVGDLLLTQVAQRLANHLAAKDILARFGGDEFVVLRTNITNSDCLVTLSNNLLESLSQPFSLHGKKIHCEAKIGITIYPFDGVSVEQLLQNADTAIHQAKQQQLNTYQFYSAAISKQLKRKLTIKENLRYVLQKEELSLRYQPRIEISTGRLIGVEALLRWYNPELGWVSPAEFIPIAEETNLIIPIGEWVLHNACLQTKQWQQPQGCSLKISVNLSACQFQQENLLETIDRILGDTKLDLACLELEITESILVDDIDRAISILWELKKRGISIALDDFGTGYSSLSYLQKLPIDNLKIDRSFVTNIASNPDNAAISKAIVALAQSMELNITAEGIETKSQYDYLKDLGCDEVQGYYFSKPLSSELLQEFLVNHPQSCEDLTSQN